MEYEVIQFTRPKGRCRVVPPRCPQNLRKGGGRRDSPGWTEQKRKTNRLRFNELRPFIKTAVTVWYPSHAMPEQLIKFNKLHQNFCKEKGIPARCVWEGPGLHQHIALGILHDAELERQWRARMGKPWAALFDDPMPEKALLWKVEVKPEETASYLSKTHDRKNRFVKGAFAWMQFNPTWETGFRALLEPATTPRKKSVESSLSDPPEKESHSDSPHYTRESAEKESERELEDPLASLRALSPLPPSGGTVKEVYGLVRAVPHRMLSLRLDRGGMEIAVQMHSEGVLQLVCAPPSASILHMLIADGSGLPPHLRMRLQKGTAIPRNFEVVYLCR